MKSITPFLWYENGIDEPIEFYKSLFPDVEVKSQQKLENVPGPTGQVISATVTIQGRDLILFNGGPNLGHTFSPATSFFVECDTQEEIDELWNKLAEEGKPSQCGWIDDKFGVTWQIVPAKLNEILGDPDPEKAKRATEAMLKMVKLDIAELERARDGV